MEPKDDDQKLEYIEMAASVLRIAVPAAIVVAFTTLPIQDAMLISLAVDYIRTRVESQMAHLNHARAINKLAKSAVESATNLNETTRIIIDLLESFKGRHVSKTIPHKEP